jgi:hypothetical protein
MDWMDKILWMLYGIIIAQLTPYVIQLFFVELPVRITEMKTELINSRRSK